MKRNRVRLEHFLYAAAFLLALAVRLFNLGAASLTDAEASLALQALALSSGQEALISPQPAYLSLTTLLMFLTGAFNAVARFWPAVAGAALVLTPLLFARQIGRIPALLLAFALALDPILLFVSRQAGSLSMALLFTLLTAGLLLRGQAVWGGISAGMALLSGPALWPGLLGIGAGLLADRLFSLPATPEDGGNARGISWRVVIFAALATIFFVGTLFFFIPFGLSGMAGGLPAYLSGWADPSGISPFLLLAGLLLYAFFPLSFGLFGAVTGLLRGNRGERFLLIWFAAALLLALIYPARQVADLSWAVIPLWALGARQLTRVLVLPRYQKVPVFGQAVLAAVILGFTSLSIIAQANGAGDGMSQQFLLRVVSSLVMLAASAMLIAWGWYRQVALRGVVLGLGFILLLYSLSTSWDAAGLSGSSQVEMAASSPRPRDLDLLQTTISDLSEWGPQQAGGLDLVVSGVESPALRWALRNYPHVRYVIQLGPDASPAFVITPVQPDLSLSATYRGQDFTLAEEVDWERFRPREWFTWMVFRNVQMDSMRSEDVILWARSDLFPGGQAQLPAGSEPEQEQQIEPQ